MKTTIGYVAWAGAALLSLSTLVGCAIDTSAADPGALDENVESTSQAVVATSGPSLNCYDNAYPFSNREPAIVNDYWRIVCQTWASQAPAAYQAYSGHVPIWLLGSSYQGQDVGSLYIVVLPNGANMGTLLQSQWLPGPVHSHRPNTDPNYGDCWTVQQPAANDWISAHGRVPANCSNTIIADPYYWAYNFSFYN